MRQKMELQKSSRVKRFALRFDFSVATILAHSQLRKCRQKCAFVLKKCVPSLRCARSSRPPAALLDRPPEGAPGVVGGQSVVDADYPGFE